MAGAGAFWLRSPAVGAIRVRSARPSWGRRDVAAGGRPISGPARPQSGFGVVQNLRTRFKKDFPPKQLVGNCPCKPPPPPLFLFNVQDPPHLGRRNLAAPNFMVEGELRECGPSTTGLLWFDCFPAFGHWHVLFSMPPACNAARALEANYGSFSAIAGAFHRKRRLKDSERDRCVVRRFLSHPNAILLR